MNIRIYFLIGLMAILTPVNPYGQDKQSVGWIEKAIIVPSNTVLDAKLDTGAETSSINAVDINKFDRDGETWVRFTVVDKTGKKVTLERKLLGVAEIKRHQGPPQKRLVVSLGICVGRHYADTNVNLVDRSRFKYPLLIGRSFMAGRLLLDPSVEYTVEPSCKER
ncbi:MAG: RimK/LysX family protein [Pseudomonadota bacterium]